MNILKANIWNNVEEQAKFIIDKYPDNFKYNFECEKNFHNAFDRYYNTIKESLCLSNSCTLSYITFSLMVL